MSRAPRDLCACGQEKVARSARCRSCWRADAARGTEHHSFKGGRRANPDGYVMIRDSARDTYVFEHRVVMEQTLGRSLLPGENVHHINGIRDDNRPENLELWVKPQPRGVRVEDAVAHAVEILRRYAPERLAHDDSYTQT